VPVVAALLAEAVDLQPVGTLAPGALEALAARLSRHVQLPVHTLARIEIALRSVDGREQLDAGALLEALEARAAEGRLLVGVTGDDIAVPVFTFVFGLARQGGAACVVSLARTDPAFYGLPADVELAHGRAVAEVLHELGHLAGLEHCRDGGCLMSFAGSIERVDSRGSRFCASCATGLPRWLRGLPPDGAEA
jgi:archaemetzincin